MQKHVNLVDLVKSFPTNIYLQNLASIQKRTSPVKFAHLAEKSGKGSISNLSTKLLPTGARLPRGPWAAFAFRRIHSCGCLELRKISLPVELRSHLLPWIIHFTIRISFVDRILRAETCGSDSTTVKLRFRRNRNDRRLPDDKKGEERRMKQCLAGHSPQKNFDASPRTISLER